MKKNRIKIKIKASETISVHNPNHIELHVVLEYTIFKYG